MDLNIAEARYEPCGRDRGRHSLAAPKPRLASEMTFSKAMNERCIFEADASEETGLNVTNLFKALVRF